MIIIIKHMTDVWDIFHHVRPINPVTSDNDGSFLTMGVQPSAHHFFLASYGHICILCIYYKLQTII